MPFRPFPGLAVLVTALVVVLVTAVVGLTAGERLGFGMRALAAGSPRASTFTNSCWMVSLFSSVTARTSA